MPLEEEIRIGSYLKRGHAEAAGVGLKNSSSNLEEVLTEFLPAKSLVR